MNARERALDRFCDEMDEYLRVSMEQDGLTFDEALDEALSEYDEYWRALYREELIEEDMTAGDRTGDF